MTFKKYDDLYEFYCSRYVRLHDKFSYDLFVMDLVV